MASKNDITGDEIKSKSLSLQGKQNFDSIFAKRTAKEWMGDDVFEWNPTCGIGDDVPISYSEFMRQKRLRGN